MDRNGGRWGWRRGRGEGLRKGGRNEREVLGRWERDARVELLRMGKGI